MNPHNLTLDVRVAPNFPMGILFFLIPSNLAQPGPSLLMAPVSVSCHRSAWHIIPWFSHLIAAVHGLAYGCLSPEEFYISLLPAGCYPGKTAERPDRARDAQSKTKDDSKWGLHAVAETKCQRSVLCKSSGSDLCLANKAERDNGVLLCTFNLGHVHLR